MRQIFKLAAEKNDTATYLMGKSKRPCWHLVRAILCLILIGPGLAAPFMESQTVWAATHAHFAYTPNTDNNPWCEDTASAYSDGAKEVQYCLFNDTHGDHGCHLYCFYWSDQDNKVTYCTHCDTNNNFGLPCQASCTGPSSSSSAASTDCTLIQGDQLVPVTCDTQGALQPTDCVKLQDDNTWVQADCSDSDADPLGNGSVRPTGGGELISLFSSLIGLIKFVGSVIDALVHHDLLGWVTCMLTAGTVPCPTVSGTPWSLDCPIVDNNNNVINATSSETIYQAALKSQGTSARADWLSGDATKPDINAAPSATQSEPGHLIYTYPADTISQSNVVRLSSFSLLIALTMIGPLFALAGFQMLLAAVKMRSQSAMANALDTLGRVLLAAAVIGLSFYMIQMLLDLTNSLNSAIDGMYASSSLSYNTAQTPNSAITGSSVISFSIAGDTPGSMRALVAPMSLWGCIIDDFIGLMASRLANMIGSGIPPFGGILGITGRVTEILGLINDIGEFVLLVLSVTIWGQAMARIFLLNYYIILAPVAFACSALPGQRGGQVLRAWFKGFLQLLFMQTVQLLILVSMPSLMPDFGLMQFPHGGSLVQGPLQSFLVQLPVIITVVAAVGAPKVMMGMGPMNTVAKAGALAGKAVAATGIAINQMIKK